MPAADIQRIAREYATAEHAMIVHNMGGFMRTENGTYAVAVGAYLAAVCGQIGHEGEGYSDAGGVCEVKTGAPIDVPNLLGEDARNSVLQVRRVHSERRSLQGERVLVHDRQPHDPVAQYQHGAQGPGEDPFVITVDEYLTSTALYSDLVLPCAGIFEMDGVLARTAPIGFS